MRWTHRLAAVLTEAVAAVNARPSRSVFTMAGTLLGVGTLVVILGLTATANGQISERFDLLKATEVTVEDTDTGEFAEPVLTAEAEQRVAGIAGVAAAGVYGQVEELPASSSLNGAATEVPIMAATPAALGAVELHLAAGREFDRWHEAEAANVVMLSSGVARRLGIDGIERQPVVFVNGVPMTVIGIYDDAARRAEEFLLAAVLPASTAELLTGERPTGMLIATDPGAAQVVAAQLAAAIDPTDPDRLSVSSPFDPTNLKDDVTGDLSLLFAGLAVVCVLISMVGIANTTMTAVTERTGEFGLRRAVGAERRHIYMQVLVESTLLGAIGGALAVSTGVVIVVAVAWLRDWTAILDPAVVGFSPLLGLGAGLLAGIYPAWRACHFTPATALRR